VKKIATIFIRDWDNNPKYVTREPNPECAWVFAGEGTATRKYDGTCVRFDGEHWWARREVKPGKTDPAGFLLIEEDAETAKRVGWEPAEQTGFAKYLTQAIRGDAWLPGTYELCGPKVNGNPERYLEHRLIRHDDAALIRPFSLTWEGIRDTVHVLAEHEGIEGIVWHHEDGRMAKVKARDFPKEKA
jgi:hypothetical protein